MKLNKRNLHQQRTQLDEKLKPWRAIAKVPSPRKGWLKAIREALGISTRQLATLLDTNNAAVLRMEEREHKGTITLDALDKVAAVMGCKLVYAIVPDESLEKIVDEKAIAAARDMMESVSHTMKLEKQEVSGRVKKAQFDDLAKDLKARLDPLLWKKRG